MGDIDLVNEYVAITSRYSTREAGGLIGMSAQTISDWRGGKLPGELRADTRRAIEDVISALPKNATDEGVIDRMVALLAADRLEDLARELRGSAKRAKQIPPDDLRRL